MEITNDSASFLAMFSYPVFRVNEGMITDANEYAREMLIEVGTPISALIQEHQYAYDTYKSGCLSLTVVINGINYVANIVRTEFGDLFHLRDDISDDILQHMGAAIDQVSQPMADIVTAFEVLKQTSPEVLDTTKGLIHAVYRLHHIATNITISRLCLSDRATRLNVRNITSILEEVFSSADGALAKRGNAVKYTIPDKIIYCAVDETTLSKTLHNLIAAMAKLTAENHPVFVEVTVCDNHLRISFEHRDYEKGIKPESVFLQYIRGPRAEDSKNAMVLCVHLAQLAAAEHRGTFLLDRPDPNNLRATLTLSLDPDQANILRSPGMFIDYTGGFDPILTDYAEILTENFYNK